MAYGRLAKPAERLAICRSRIRRAKDKRQSYHERVAKRIPKPSGDPTRIAEDGVTGSDDISTPEALEGIKALMSANPTKYKAGDGMSYAKASSDYRNGARAAK